MSADTITFARPAGGRLSLAKVIHVRGERIVGKDASPNVSVFDYTEVPVHDLRSLYIEVRRAAAQGDIAIRGKPKGSRGNRRMYLRDGIEPFCEVVPRRWVGFDWDDLPLDGSPARTRAGNGNPARFASRGSGRRSRSCGSRGSSARRRVFGR
jgi:hypothetical protein